MRWVVYILQLILAFIVFVVTYAMVQWQSDGSPTNSGVTHKFLSVARNYPSTLVVMGFSIVYFLVVLFLIYKNRGNKGILTPPADKSLWFMLVGLIFSIFFFFVASLFTVDPYVSDINADISRPLVYATTLIFIYFLISFGFYTYRRLLRHSEVYKVVVIFAGSLLLLLSIVGEKHLVKNRLFQLGGGPSIPNSQIFHLGWFNKYTNILYFNIYNFLTGISIILIITGFWTVFKRKIKGFNS